MFRRGGNRVAVASPLAGTQVTIVPTLRTISTTGVALQLQHRDRILGSTHGAGIIKHGSMATTNLSEQQQRRIPRGVTQAAPAADLFRTEIHEGLGTSAEDPYFRTLPNVESRPPETTVLQGARVSAPTLDEVASLGKRWATMQYWIGDSYPRLPLYLRSLVVPNALPVSAHAERLIADFPAQLESIMRGASEGDRANISGLWTKALDAYGAVSAKHIFDRAGFEHSLAELHAQTLAAVTKVTGDQNVSLPFEVLRRKAILKRNRFLEEGLVRLLENGSYLGFGDGIWRIFFAAAERHKEAIFGGESARMLGFAWDAIAKEDSVRTPALSGIVALYLTLSSIAQSQALITSDVLKTSSRRVDEGLSASDLHQSGDHFDAEMLHLVNPIVKRKFTMEHLRELLSSADGAKHLSKALRAAGFHELSREAALCEAMNDDTRLLEADAAPLIDYFDSTQEVKTLLASLVKGTNDTVRQHVLQTFGQSTGTPSTTGAARQGGNVDWEKVFLSVDWDTNWRRLASTLLSDASTLDVIRQVVGSAIGAKGAVKRLFSQEYHEALKQVSDMRVQRASVKRARVDHIVEALSSFQHVDEVLQIMKQLGVPMAALAKEATALGEAQKRNRPVIEASVLEAVLAEAARRHPTWVKAGVLPADLTLPSSGGQLSRDGLTKALALMARMYVRVAYVPQSGSASVAQHTRRRIGPVATEPFQFNVPTEVGFVEQYDNLQYKRYDWQGWYQRMTDVHNRNISVRCRIDDLKRLDGFGNPFVDLQTERRMRILAGDRVGMGVIKLDSDRYEDQSDNVTYGTGKLSEVLAESRKAQLGPEYWPTVEVKVRRPSGQSQAYYSTVDNDRIEKRSKELYEKYRDAKKRSLFVTPMDLWLEVKGMQVRKTTDTADADGYTVDSLQDSLGNE